MRCRQQGSPMSAGNGAFCVWFTGLPASGKSTTAQILLELLEGKGCLVQLLDGDALRKSVSKDLGFSQRDRDEHIRRVGSFASELVCGGTVAIAAVISPYRSIREECRHVVGPERFVEVFVDTPLEVCEARDPKGLYAKARAGAIPNFTGVSDPYEPPKEPEIRLNTVEQTAEQNAELILARLNSRGLLPSH